MPIKVTLPGIFARHTNGTKSLESTATTLPELIKELIEQYPGLAAALRDKNGNKPSHIHVYVNDEDIRFLGGEKCVFKNGQEVLFMGAVAGG